MIKPCHLCKREFEDLHGVRYCSFICRLFSKIEVRGADECWPCISSTKRYGSIMLPDQRNVGIHVVVYGMFHGSLPDGQFACHSCDNKACCNPAHLWPGTNQENQLDASVKGRLAWGERNNHAIFTNEQVMAIRVSGDAAPKLAVIFGCNPETIRRIRRGESWKNLAA